MFKKINKLTKRKKSSKPGENEMTKNNETNSVIGKKMIVRANVAGVHAGIVESLDASTQTVTLTNAYRLWRFYTRDKTGSVSDVAANGLKPNGGHSIGARLPSVIVINPNGLELAEMTDEAYASIEAWRN
jgi:hypothetical protein